MNDQTVLWLERITNIVLSSGQNVDFTVYVFNGKYTHESIGWGNCIVGRSWIDRDENDGTIEFEFLCLSILQTGVIQAQAFEPVVTKAINEKQLKWDYPEPATT